MEKKEETNKALGGGWGWGRLIVGVTFTLGGFDFSVLVDYFIIIIIIIVNTSSMYFECYGINKIK